MCGIVGVFSSVASVTKSEIVRLVASIRHRGPDQEDIFIDERHRVGLGFVRLAILDLSPSGAQPMVDRSGRYVITFNGEVYNYIELRRELQKLGYSFETGTDTEVVLYSFVEWGVECFSRLRGMWGIAIYDTRDDVIYLSRDYFGIKPLYYYSSDNAVYWASEIKAFSCMGDLREDLQTSVEFLELGLQEHSNRTFFQGVRLLLPSHYAVVRLKDSAVSVNVLPYWDLASASSVVALPVGEKAIVEKFRSILTHSIDISLRSDVPIWVLLSGGLDSSTIASVIHHLHPEQTINALTVVHDDPKINELEYVREVVRRKNCTLTEVRINNENWVDELDRFVYHQDEPTSSTSILNHWFLMKELSRQGVKVILSGQGVDEVQYGYIRMFMGYFFSDLFSSGRYLTLFRELYKHWKDRDEIVPNFNTSGSYLSGLIGNKEFYMQAIKGLVPQSIAKSLKAQYIEKSTGIVCEEFREMKQPYNPFIPAGFDQLHSAMYRMLTVEAIPRILKSEDRSSMAFSIEERVPFIDRDIIEYLFAISSEYKVKDATSKWILREAMKGILPESVRTRRSKLGFNSPEKAWVTGTKFKEYIRDNKLFDYLQGSVVERDKFESYYQDVCSGRREYSSLVWRVLHYAMWRKRFSIQ